MDPNLPVLTRRRLLWYGLCAGLLAGLSPRLAARALAGDRSPKKPSVYLIVIDTLRADHLGCYGYARDTSPNIDRFASGALLFENCVAHAPHTNPSMACLLSGFLPHEHQLLKHDITLSKSLRTMPEMFQEHGYRTGAVISNYNLRRRLNWAKGFDVYDDTMDSKEAVRDTPERLATGTTDRAVEMIREFGAEPKFLWVHYQDPHGPYTPPKDHANRFWNPEEQAPRELRVNTTVTGRGGIPAYQKLPGRTDYHYYVSQYDAEIRYLDEQFQRLLEAIEASDPDNDALVILTSDHGEGMGERDYYFAHGENLSSGLLHVPLLIRRGKTLTGRRKDFVQHLDLLPTALRTCGIESDSRFRGKDLRGTIEQPREIYSAGPSGMKSLVYDGFKLIWLFEGSRRELYDVRTDPRETTNLINEDGHRERVRDLETRLKRVAAEDRLRLGKPPEKVELSDDEIEKLRALGYVD